MKKFGMPMMVLVAFGIYLGTAGNEEMQCTPEPTGCVSDADCGTGEFCDAGAGECISFYDCTVDEDCAKVKAGCCPCSAGGKSTAINKNYLDEWETALDCDPNTMCPMVYLCDGLALPECVDGQCELTKLPDKKYCDTVDDCVCGGFDTDGSCFLGNKLYYNEYVDKTGVCPDFCGGFHGMLKLACVDHQCTQVSR